MKTAKFGILIIAVGLLASCKKGGVFCYREDGNIITQERSVGSFTEVALSDIGHVYVEQADQQSVIVETSSNLQDIIVTEVKGNTLEIKTKKGKCIKGNPTLNVYVKTPNLNALTISGSGSIYASRLVTTSNMELCISGSGDITLDSLSTDDLKATISGSGNIVVEGADTMSYENLNISGSGNITTINYPALKAKATISGSGSCKVHAINELNVSISGSGDVLYRGTPAITNSSSGSGTVKPY
ncbi:MAG: head GIN domain-containing protein [Crocinitomicaceae bacterium]